MTKPVLFLSLERLGNDPVVSVLECLLRQLLPLVENLVPGTIVRILWVEGGYDVFFDSLERLRKEEPKLYRLWSDQPADPRLKSVRCAIPWIALFPRRLLFGNFVAFAERGNG